jgi:hypothetical protein
MLSLLVIALAGSEAGALAEGHRAPARIPIRVPAHEALDGAGFAHAAAAPGHPDRLAG